MPNNESVFHSGEQAVQDRMGVREQIGSWASQVVRPFMPEEHRQFFADQPFLVAAARDKHGRAWATLLAGPPRFIRSSDPTQLEIETQPVSGDALEEAFHDGADIGLLGIEFATRRRNRVNGRVAASGTGRFTLKVDQSFGNCPQYIHPLEWERVALSGSPDIRRMNALDASTAEWIEQANAFFIASGHREDESAAYFGMDVSHRGGAPGFVRIEADGSLVFPDYAGNQHFNTIGNLVVDPRVGLLFINFEEGHLLQISGRAQIDWDSPDVEKHPGAQRLVRIEIDSVVELRHAVPIRWRAPHTAQKALRVAAKKRESEDVISFLLVPEKGTELASFEPGQHLPIDLEIPGQPHPVARTYSLSTSPHFDHYRLTIKREEQGLASRFLHDDVKVGQLLRTKAPSGDFRLKSGTRPVILISAGVGITPMTSMLEKLAEPEEKREVWFLYGARDGAHHPLAREVERHVQAHHRIHSHTAYSQPRKQDRQGIDFDSKGRINGDLLRTVLPDLNADFYLCGPLAFLSTLLEALRAFGVPEDRIHFETFGPSVGAAKR